MYLTLHHWQRTETASHCKLQCLEKTINRKTTFTRWTSILYIRNRQFHCFTLLSQLWMCKRNILGTPGGCEAAVHTTRHFLEKLASDHVVVKLDCSNAFILYTVETCFNWSSTEYQSYMLSLVQPTQCCQFCIMVFTLCCHKRVPNEAIH